MSKPLNENDLNENDCMGPLVRICSNYDISNILRQTPGSHRTWDGVRFTIDPVSECDYLVIFNNCQLDPVAVRCPAAHLWAVMQEPYIPNLFDWMIEGHEPFARVFTHHPPSGEPKYVRSHPALPWFVNKTFDELIDAVPQQKGERISFITSNLTWLPGHRNRTALRHYLAQQEDLPVDIYGHGIRFIADKWDGLAPYRFALAIENSNSADYWTEKVTDCFLSWTVPLYDGCTNLEDYFPAESFIRIDASDPATVADCLRRLSTEQEWSRRLPAIAEARRRILMEYQIFPFLCRAIREYGDQTTARDSIVVPGYSRTFWKHRVRHLAARIRNRELQGLGYDVLNKLRYLRKPNRLP
jgi:hypothetical protein